MISVLALEKVDYLDSLLLEDGLLKPVFSADLEKIPHNHLMIWGKYNGVYTFVTFELIEWLKNEIGKEKTIEICSGTGIIGRALQIVRTDSYMQAMPEMQNFYNLLGEHPILPPDDVLEFEANEAVDNFKPDTVIAAFATQKFIEGDTENKIGSSVYGVDELAMLPKIKKYITIGNSNVHGDKRILALPHKKYSFPWLFTRCLNQEKNEITIWNNYE